MHKMPHAVVIMLVSVTHNLVMIQLGDDTATGFERWLDKVPGRK